MSVRVILVRLPWDFVSLAKCLLRFDNYYLFIYWVNYKGNEMKWVKLQVGWGTFASHLAGEPLQRGPRARARASHRYFSFLLLRARGEPFWSSELARDGSQASYQVNPHFVIPQELSGGTWAWIAPRTFPLIGFSNSVLFWAWIFHPNWEWFSSIGLSNQPVIGRLWFQAPLPPLKFYWIIRN